MELNTIPGHATITHHAARLQLAPEATHRLTSMLHTQTKWRASVTRLADLTLIEQALLLIITPREALDLFPGMRENIYALGHEEVSMQFRRAEWVQMSSILASTGLYFVIKNKIPVPLGVARACAFMCSGIFIPKHLENAKIVGEAMQIDPLLSVCALEAFRAPTVDNPDVSRVIDYVTSLFTISKEPAPPKIYTLKPAFADSTVSVSEIVHYLCSWFGCPEAFGPEDDANLAFFCETTAGMDTSDFRACIPVGRWMLVVLCYSLLETNIRAALRCGYYIPYFDPTANEYFLKKDVPGIAWSTYLPMYYSPAGPGVDAWELRKFYMDHDKRTADIIPILVHTDTEYQPREDMGKFDILQSKMARSALGADIWEVRNNAHECLSRVREAILNQKAPPKLAKEICTRYTYKPRVEKKPTLVWTAGDQLLNTGIETPQYVDPGAWACVHLFPINVFAPAAEKDVFPSLFDTMCEGDEISFTL